jgi:cysteine synthase A
MRDWINQAIKIIEADFQRSSDTHLVKLNIADFPGIDIYLKDESTHPTGSLKHRLARSLFLYALCNNWIKQGTTVVEASSGSTAVSEAYFAQMIGVPFIAVMPSSTARSKIRQIEHYGGQCHFVEKASQVREESTRLAESTNGYFMDQFTYAERATDWRGNNNIAESIFQQMQCEPYPIPHAVVMSAGTGGTSATLGRYFRYRAHATQLTVVDPENSVYFDYYHNRDTSLTCEKRGRIEGIGRPQVEPSFQADVVDRMLRVPDAASIATMRWLETLTGRKAGASTGTNLWGVFHVAREMQANQQFGSIVTLMCDSGERYLDTYYDDEWVVQNIGDLQLYADQLPTL